MQLFLELSVCPLYYNHGISCRKQSAKCAHCYQSRLCAWMSGWNCLLYHSATGLAAVCMVCTPTVVCDDCSRGFDYLVAQIGLTSHEQQRERVCYSPCWNCISTARYCLSSSCTTFFMWPRIPLRYLRHRS